MSPKQQRAVRTQRKTTTANATPSNPLGLHRDCIRRLREVVATAIPSIEVSRGAILTPASLTLLRSADDVLPQSGTIHERLMNFVSDTPASTFIYHRLNRAVLGLGLAWKGDAPRVQPLQSIPAFRNPTAVSKRIVDEFASLPWNYSIALAMPKALADLITPEGRVITLSERMILVAPNDAYQAAYPVPSEDNTSTQWSVYRFVPDGTTKGNAYLKLEATGFISSHGTTATLETVQSTMKEFAGLGIALGLFAPPEHLDDLTEPRLVVHRRDDEKWVFDCELHWEAHQSLVLAELELDPAFDDLSPDEFTAVHLQHELQRIAAVFSSTRTQRIRRATQWLFDSICEHDLPLAFVKAAVVMEVLLGEKAASDVVGLSELLANRLAFLVGPTPDERDQLILRFKEVYAVRSRIVHEGKSTLSTREREQLEELRGMCCRVIKRELSLLGHDTKPDLQQHPLEF